MFCGGLYLACSSLWELFLHLLWNRLLFPRLAWNFLQLVAQARQLIVGEIFLYGLVALLYLVEPREGTPVYGG